MRRKKTSRRKKKVLRTSLMRTATRLLMIKQSLKTNRIPMKQLRANRVRRPRKQRRRSTLRSSFLILSRSTILARSFLTTNY